MALHQSGQLEQAENLYKKAITADRSNSDAEQFLGLLLLQRGRPTEGIRQIRRAIAINPRVPPYYDNLGAALESTGDAKGALDSFKKASAIDAEKNPERSFGIANALAKLGRTREAESAYREAISQNPADSAFHFNLGGLLKSQDRLHEACECYRAAAACRSPVGGALNNLGTTLRSLGRYAEARSVFEQILEEEPEDFKALINLASVSNELGQADVAASLVTRARKHPEFTAMDNMIRVLQLSGFISLGKSKYMEALASFRQVLQVQPDHRDAKAGLANVFRWLQPSAYDVALVNDLHRLLDEPEIAHQRFARLIANQLCYRINDLIGAGSEEMLSHDLLCSLSEEKLLIVLLSRLTNTDAELEIPLKQIRFSLLGFYADSSPSDEALVRLASALAIQAFHTEHIIPCSKQELELYDSLALISDIKDALEEEQFGLELEWMIAILGMYEPLERYCGELPEALLQHARSPLFKMLIRRAVKEPLEENRLREDIPELQQVTNKTSVEVRAQYEEHSYPRWFYLAPAKPSSYRDFLCGRFSGLQLDRQFAGRVSVLVAGCGTGQEAALIARSRLVDGVVGLDLSKSSLAYAERMRRKLKLKNIRFIQGDILDSGGLGKQFHIIESTGVLHHMAEPLLGWETLTRCLVSGGLMKVGLYSERASREIQIARQWIEEQGFNSDSATIRAVRQKVLDLEKSHPLYSLRFSEDFFSVSACRDLIFHVQEQCYSPSQLKEMLDHLALEFIGFELPDVKTKQQYVNMFPNDLTLTDLDNWEEYERQYPSTFSGMFVFWCRRSSD